MVPSKLTCPRTSLAELVGRDLEAGSLRRRHDDRGRVRKFHHFRIAQPIRRRDDDLVAGVAGGEDGVATGMLGAAVDDDLRWFVGETVIRLELLGDSGAQFGDAGRRGVFGEAVAERLDGGVLDELRRVEIRLTGTEAADVNALGFELLGLGIDREGE